MKHKTAAKLMVTAVAVSLTTLLAAPATHAWGGGNWGGNNWWGGNWGNNWGWNNNWWGGNWCNNWWNGCNNWWNGCNWW